MAALHPLYQEIFDDRTGRHFTVTRVAVTGTGDTVQLPTGVTNANQVTVTPVDTADTVATVDSITQRATDLGDATLGGTTVTLAGGTANSQQIIFAVHGGNAAGLGV